MSPLRDKAFLRSLFPIEPICFDFNLAPEDLPLAHWLHRRGRPFFCKRLKARVRPVYFNFKDRMTVEIMSI